MDHAQSELAWGWNVTARYPKPLGECRACKDENLLAARQKDGEAGQLL
jgi:hypothetical protein